MLTKLKFISYLLISIILTFVLSLSLQSVLADWTAPTDPPPTDSIKPLIYNSKPQANNGVLIATSTIIGGTFGVSENLIVNGNVGIGTVNPGAKLQINPPASAEGLRIITASDQSPLNIRNSVNTADIFRIDQNGDIRVGKTVYKDASGNVIIQLGN